MKQTRFLLLMLLLATTLAAGAQSASPRLVVWQKNGQKDYFELSGQPETTFQDGKLVIRMPMEGFSFRYQLDNVLRYTYEGVGSSGIELLQNERVISLSQEGDAVTFRGLSQGTVVSLYAANGKLLEQHRAEGFSPLTFSVSSRPSGVYIVKAGNETIKLLRK